MVQGLCRLLLLATVLSVIALDATATSLDAPALDAKDEGGVLERLLRGRGRIGTRGGRQGSGRRGARAGRHGARNLLTLVEATDSTLSGFVEQRALKRAAGDADSGWRDSAFQSRSSSGFGRRALASDAESGWRDAALQSRSSSGFGRRSLSGHGEGGGARGRHAGQHMKQYWSSAFRPNRG